MRHLHAHPEKIVCVDRPIFQTKHVFWEGTAHDPEQSKDLETRIKTPRVTLKNTTHCNNALTEIPNFDWRTVGGLKPLAAARPRSTCASRSHARALAAGLPHQDHV